MPIASTVTLASGLIVPVMQYNSTIDGDGFYVSHNDHDVAPSLYGGETTALVLGQMEKFYILNGDHREAYTALISSGYEACLISSKQTWPTLTNVATYYPTQPDRRK